MPPTHQTSPLTPKLPTHIQQSPPPQTPSSHNPVLGRQDRELATDVEIIPPAKIHNPLQHVAQRRPSQRLHRMLLDLKGDPGTVPIERGLGDWRIAVRRDEGADDVVQGPFDNGGHEVAVEGGVRVDIFTEDKSRGGVADGEREGVWDDVFEVAGRSGDFFDSISGREFRSFLGGEVGERG